DAFFEVPGLVDADVELVERRITDAVRRIRLRRNVGSDVVVVEAVRLRCSEAARDETEARAHLPTATEPVATDRREDVRLVEIEEPFRLSGGVAPHAPRQRVCEEAEEPLVGLVAEERLETVSAAFAGIALALHDDAVVLAIKRLRRHLDLARDLLFGA